ncbi:MAG: glycosyltransferase family 2 protein [Candidatus Margulisiibacteriota bacterium]
MKQPLLSIGIPTYNRALLLKQAVESILAQAEKNMQDTLEIVISDNASTDDTSAVVAALQAESQITINYFKNERNFDFDANMLLVVERSHGKYVWVLGDDDLLALRSLKNVMQELCTNVQIDLYLGEKEDFLLTPDRPMHFRRIMRSLLPEVFDFNQKENIEKYFKNNKKLIAYCNYISNIIFKREKWLCVKNKEEYLGSGYIHLYAFWSLLWGRDPGKMKCLPLPLVNRRWGSDGLTDPEARLKQDILMYHRIAKAIFNDKKYVYMIDDMVIRNDGFSWAVRVKLNSPKRFWTLILPLMFTYYWDHVLFWTKIVPLAFIPNLLLGLMRWIYRKEIKGEPISAQELMAH